MAKKSDSQAGPIAVLLVVLCAAGAWNYHRNATIENAVPRPYKGYSDEELNQLVSAYQVEVELQTQRYHQAMAGTDMSVQGGGLLEDRIDEFERVQRLSKQRQRRADMVTENQVLVEELAKERILRDRDRPVYKMIQRRVFSF